MVAMDVSARRGAPEDTEADTRVVGIFEDEAPTDPLVRELVDAGEAKAALRKVAVAHEEAGGARRRVIVAGLGKREGFGHEPARVAAASVASRARDIGARSLSWAVPGEAPDGVVEALVEGTLLALYRFDRFKSSADDEDRGRVVTIELSSSDADLSEEVHRARVSADAQNAARDLQNLPANVATPSFLADRASELADAHDALSVEVFGREEITGMAMGAFAAVAQGSDVEPRLIVLRYEGGGSGPHLGYVGKAVTFDTGGISIKPSAKMQEMKFDMSGGAAVIEALGAVAKLRLPVRITAVVASTENMPSGHAMKPGDIVTAKNGKTIEVNNTDAEGRLVLADALAYCVEQGAERI
ncbi:MAG: leucyl aminopeptidase family protein, partial [Thermoleophilaceae bacterium]